MELAKYQSIAVILLFFIQIMSPALAASFTDTPRMDAETFEIQFAEATAAAQDGHHEQALSAAKALAKLAPNNLDVISLLVQEAWTTGKREVLDQATQLRTLATQKAKIREKLEDQLRLIDKDLSADRLKKAKERMELVIRQLNCGINPAQVQIRLVALANALYIRSYLGDAYWLYQQVVNMSSRGAQGDPGEDDDLDSVAVSLIMLENLKKRNIFLMGTFSGTYDSNPFGYPSGTQSTDGTPNNELATTLKLDFTLRGPVRDASPLYYSLYANATDYRALSQAGRAQFDSESAAAGLGLGAATISSGRALFRYIYQYVQTPFAQTESAGASSYVYGTVSRIHSFNLDLSREMSTQIDLSINAHANFAQYVSPDDFDYYNRSGNTLGGYSELNYHTESAWLTPLLRAGIDRDLALGETNSYLETYLRVGDYFHFLNRKGNGLVTAEYGHYNYDQYPGGRLDNVFRASVNLDYSLSRSTRIFSQGFYSNGSSTVDYYTQSRLIVTLGLAFSIEN